MQLSFSETLVLHIILLMIVVVVSASLTLAAILEQILEVDLDYFSGRTQGHDVLVLLVDAKAVDSLVVLVKDLVLVDDWWRVGPIGGAQVGKAGVVMEIGGVGVVGSA